jgi:hypothetical protein
MNVKTIFKRNEKDEVPVPEIEVQGDRLRIPNPEPELGGQENLPDGPQNTRDLSLPKTKWF